MKLAFICSDRSLAVFGASGRSSYLREVLRAVARRADQVQLFAARLDGDRPEGMEKLRIHKLSQFGSDLASDNSSMLSANRELRRMLDGARGGRFDGVFERFSPWSYAGVEYANHHNIPSILEVTESGWEDLLKLPEDVQRIAIETLRSASHVIAGSETLGKALMERGIASTLSAGGIDPESYSAGTRPSARKSGIFTVGYLGSMESWEELLPLVDAFTQMHRKHPETRLLVEGDGPAKAQMIAELSRRGLLGTACFLGRVSLRRIPGVLAAIDVAVVPERSARGTRLREILLSAIPLICCAEDTTPVLRHIVSAYHCAAGDAQVLTDALRVLYADRILRMRLGSSGRREVFREETWDLIASAIVTPIQSRRSGSVSLPALVAKASREPGHTAL